LFREDESHLKAALVFGLIPLGILVVMFRAQNDSYVVDPENDSFTYLGGKINYRIYILSLIEVVN
jgi:hypothetical protein